MIELYLTEISKYVIAGSMAAFTIADAFCEKFGSDSLSDIKSAYAAYLEKMR